MRISPRAFAFELLLAAVFATVAGVAAFYLGQRLPAGYQATVDYRVVDDPLLTGVGADVYRDIVTSEEVLRAALAGLGEPDADSERLAAFRREVRASVVTGPAGERRLRIAAEGDAPEAAERRVEALAAALEAWDRSATPTRATQAAARLDERIAALGERIRSLQVLGSPDAEIDELVAERERLVVLQQRARTGSLPNAALERVASGRAEVAPATARNVALAAAAAALLSFALGLRRPRRRGQEVRPPRAVNRSEPTERARRTGRAANPLRRADAGSRGGGAKGPAVRLLASYPNTGDREVLRRSGAQLRASLGTLLPDVRPRVVLVTGLADGCGASTVARYLAEASARRGSGTLLVDGDLRAPGVADAYGLAAGSDGVTTTLDWLQNPSGPQRVARVVVDGGVPLDVVPQFRAVRPAPGTAEALFDEFGEALRQWSDYELIVVDAAPVRSVTDTRLLARWATGVVLVAAPGSSDERSWNEVRRSLGEAASRLAGLVENEAPPAPAAQPEDEEGPPSLRIRDAGTRSSAQRRSSRRRPGREPS